MPWEMDIVARRIFPDTDPGGTGTIDIATVPADEYWELFAVYAARGSGTTLTMSKLQIKDIRYNTEMPVKNPSAAAILLHEFSPELPVVAGSVLQVMVIAHGATDSFWVNAYYRRWKNVS